VSTADPPFYRSRDYRLTTGLPPCHGPFREKLHIDQLRAALTLSGGNTGRQEVHLRWRGRAAGLAPVNFRAEPGRHVHGE